jgi:hypothetical protein
MSASEECCIDGKCVREWIVLKGEDVSTGCFIGLSTSSTCFVQIIFIQSN